MKTYNTVIVGGGSSGILASIYLNDNKSLLLEKNDILCKKLLMTGGGRCNLTNNSSFNEYMKNFYNSGKYYRTAFTNFFNKDIVKLLEDNGCKTKIEENNRVFPSSDRSKSVQKTLIKLLNESKTNYDLNSTVKNIEKEKEFFVITYNNKRIKSKFVILSTGGTAYPETGSNGDGFRFAKKLGHEVSDSMGGLSPIEIKEQWINTLQGISINVKLEVKGNKKSLIKDDGSIIFTQNGISGFPILDNSMLIEKHLRKNEKVIINLDFCKCYSYDELEKKLITDFSNNSNKTIKTYVHNFLPKRMSKEFLKHLDIDCDKVLNQISKKERNKIKENLKRTSLTVKKVLEEEAFVTNSGIIRKEINPDSFESNVVPGLYITGELIEGCGICGGYNLQQAYSTGVLAALSIKKRLKHDSS